jgi:hypothetical protein
VGASAAEEAFEKAKSLGASIDRYLDPLASAAFAQAKDLLDKKKFPEADAKLTDIEKRYPKTPWLASHKGDLASAREAARSGIAESEAEKLYAEAAKLFEKKELFDLKPLIEKLKKDYPTTKPVTDAARKPTFAEMLKATETLGRFITVRQDGKGDFKTIQAAIDAAPPNSLIEVRDRGPYYEAVCIAKAGLRLRGARHVFPLICSSKAIGEPHTLLEASAPGAVVEAVAIAHANYREEAGMAGQAVVVRAGPFSIRSALVYVGPDKNDRGTRAISVVGGNEVTIENSVVLGNSFCESPMRISNCLWLQSGIPPNGYLLTTGDAEVRLSTIVGGLGGWGEPAVLVRDCIVGGVVKRRNSRVLSSDVFGGLTEGTEQCFTADPQFRDAANLDYRLKPTSPCRKKASDGGDIGCRYTPEMMEMLEKALELRKKGIIKF